MLLFPLITSMMITIHAVVNWDDIPLGTEIDQTPDGDTLTIHLTWTETDLWADASETTTVQGSESDQEDHAQPDQPVPEQVIGETAPETRSFGFCRSCPFAKRLPKMFKEAKEDCATFLNMVESEWMRVSGVNRDWLARTMNKERAVQRVPESKHTNNETDGKQEGIELDNWGELGRDRAILYGAVAVGAVFMCCVTCCFVQRDQQEEKEEYVKPV